MRGGAAPIVADSASLAEICVDAVDHRRTGLGAGAGISGGATYAANVSFASDIYFPNIIILSSQKI